MSIKSSDNQESNDLLAFKNSKIEIHFRFLCQTPAVEKLLIDSMSRAWTEISQFFYNQPITADLGNTYNDTLFPFTKKNKDRVTSLEIWEPEVYQSDFGICGSPNALGFSIEKPLKNKKIKTIYNEQFVYRASIFVTHEEYDIQVVEDVIYNLLQNTDIPGVTILSIEDKSNDKNHNLDISNILPELSSYFCYQPINCRKRGDAISVDINKMPWIDNCNLMTDWSCDPNIVLTDFIYEDDNNEILMGPSFPIKTENKQFEKITLETLIGHCGDFGSEVQLLSSQYNGFDFPIWKMALFESELILARVINIPSSSSIEGAMEQARNYPSLSKFGDRWGTEYIEALLSCDVESISGIILDEISLERDMDFDGNAVFSIDVYGHNENLISVFIGGEDLLCLFFEKVVQYENEISPINLEGLMSISSDLGGLPESVSKKLLTKFNIN